MYSTPKPRTPSEYKKSWPLNEWLHKILVWRVFWSDFLWSLNLSFTVRNYPATERPFWDQGGVGVGMCYLDILPLKINLFLRISLNSFTFRILACECGFIVMCFATICTVQTISFTTLTTVRFNPSPRRHHIYSEGEIFFILWFPNIQFNLGVISQIV